MTYLLIGCQWLVGVVFLLSFVSKVRGRDRLSAFTAAATDLAPRLPAKVVVPLVLVGEAVVAGTVVVPAMARIGFSVALGLLGVFTVSMASAIRKRRLVVCQCFGASAAHVGPAHLVRNAVLMLGAGGGLVAPLGVPSASTADVAGAVLAAVTGAVIAGITMLTDEMAELFRPMA